MGINNIIKIAPRARRTETFHYPGSAGCVVVNHMYGGISIQHGPSLVAELKEFEDRTGMSVIVADDLSHTYPQIIIAV